MTSHHLRAIRLFERKTLFDQVHRCLRFGDYHGLGNYHGFGHYHAAFLNRQIRVTPAIQVHARKHSQVYAAWAAGPGISVKACMAWQSWESTSSAIVITSTRTRLKSTRARLSCR